MAKTTLQGVVKFTQALLKAGEKKRRAAERGVYRAALFVQRESQKICPVDTGALRNSARTTLIRRGVNSVATVSYHTNYAIFVHENLEARHKKGKRAKFLESILRTKQRDIQRIMREEVRRG